jgi:hypothetical protein
LKGNCKYLIDYLIILFAGNKTLITFAPAFRAKFIWELRAVENRVKKVVGIKGKKRRPCKKLR